MTKASSNASLNSRKARMQRNPIAWIILLILAIALWGAMVIPGFVEWQQKRSENATLETLTKTLQQSNDAKSQELERKEAEFDLMAGPYIVREKQWFPKTIDTGKVVKILELYALQLENLDSSTKDSKFELTKVLFDRTKRDKKNPYSTTMFSLNFVTDEENLKEFINFLQTGTISSRITEGKNTGQIELVDYKFLENNLLPLVHILSIQTTVNAKTNTIDVRMKADLFSQ